MRISTSQLYARPTSLMSTLTEQADKIQTSIATTKRLTTPSEDTGAYLRLASLSRAGANDGAYSTNITLAQGLLEQSDTALDSVESQLQHALELATSAANGTLSDSNRAAVATEIDTLRDALLALANTKDVRGEPLFGGATGGIAYVKNADGSISFASSGEPASIPIGDQTAIQGTVSGASAFAAGGSDMFAVLGALSDALKAGGDTHGAATDGIAGIQAALDSVGLARASIGARGARLDLDSDRLTAAAETREVARSAIEDTDIPTAVADLQKTLTVLQATQASFTKLSSLSLFDYLR